MSAHRDERSRSPVPWLLAAALLAGAVLAARWPGVAMYDSVAQYDQAVTGDYTDWHPPIMAHAWALAHRAWAGTAPMFVAHMLLWWGGIGLLSAALGRAQRHGAAAAVLIVGALPLFAGWASVVLKDVGMAAALLAATGLVAWWRLARRRLPRAAIAGVAALILYATLVRGNAPFATVPFALALARWGGIARPLPRAALALAGMAGVIAVAPLVNRAALGAEATHVERTLPVYDLAGIAHLARLPTLPGVPPALWRAGEARGCYTPFFWNPYGEPALCDAIGRAAGLDEDGAPALTRRWVRAILTHPLAYAAHRLGHLNANLRFWVGPGEPDAVPPAKSEPNGYGLGARPTPAGRALVAAAAAMAVSPLGWPCLYLALAVVLLWAGAAARGPQAALGRALALSAAVMSASFAVVSIASDLRYHLWSMVAALLAAVLLADAGALARRRLRMGGAGLAALTLAASAAHLGLAPRVPLPLPPHAAVSVALP